MTYMELVKRVAKATGIHKTDVKEVIHAITHEIAELQEGERLVIQGFGTFERRSYVGRPFTVYNPHLKKKVKGISKPFSKVVFKASKKIRQKLR